MRISIQLPDALYETLEERAKESHVRLTSYVGNLVKMFGHLNPTDRILILEPKARGELETILGGGHLLSQEDLVNKVRSVTDILVEKVELKFTAGQKKELKRRAERQGISYPEMVKRTVKSMESQFFDHVA